MNIAIIPARSGSRRIPGKNKRLFHGRPIIEYSIDAARESSMFGMIVVSTDDDDIRQIAFNAGAHVIRRPDALAVNEIGTQEVARDALVTMSMGEDGQTYDYACVIYPTAPLMSPIDIARGFAELHESRKAFAFSVGPEEQVDAGQFYWGHVWAFMGRVPLSEYYAHTVKIDPRRAWDINYESDWLKVEQMYSALQGQK